MNRTTKFFGLLVLGASLFGAGCGPDGSSSSQPDGYVFPDARPRPDAAACTDHCSNGERQCVTGGYQECGNYDADSCLEWGPVRPCGANEECEPATGNCVTSTCTDDCIQGSVRCDPDTAVEGTQACEQGGDGCYHWAATVPCTGNDTCSGGVCSGTCSDECTNGSRQCASDAGGEGVQVCDNYDADSCLEWGPITYCNTGETCSNGQCDVGCANECTQGELRCDGADGFQECGDFDADNCLEWSQKQLCPVGENCSNGVCDINCVDECDTLGYRECTTAGDGFRECVDSDPDPCFEWTLPTSCNTGETCVSGQCVTPCNCDYYPNICEPDAPNSTTPCACDPDCGGGAQPCTADGHCDTWCPAGTDPDCGGSCACQYNGFCEADAPDSSSTCACDPNCEVNEYACSDDAHCDSYCPAGWDPDCSADPCRIRRISAGLRWGDDNPDDLLLYDSYEYPDPVEGSWWVLLSPDFSSGTAEVFVQFGAPALSCVDAISVEVWGYDDALLGDGAEIYIYNWDNWEFDVLPDTVGSTYDAYETFAADVAPYVLCTGTGQTDVCWIDAKVTASAWDNTHLETVEVFLYVSP